MIASFKQMYYSQNIGHLLTLSIVIANKQKNLIISVFICDNNRNASLYLLCYCFLI